MRNLLAIAAALTFVVAATPGTARSPVGLGQSYPVACGPGYHPDAGGNCQPNGGQTNRECPPGMVVNPSPDANGWKCDPPPPEAY